MGKITHNLKSIVQVRVNDILNEHCSSNCPGCFATAIVRGVIVVHARNVQYFFEQVYIGHQGNTNLQLKLGNKEAEPWE